MLRALRPLLLRGLIPALAGLAAGATLPGEHRPAALVFLGAAVAAVWGPLEGAGRRPVVRSLAAAAGALLGTAVPAAALGGAAPGAAVAAGAAIGAFLLLGAGVAAAAGRALRSTAAGVALGAGISLVFAASFHLGDPFLEWWGPNRASPFALDVLHAVNPLSGAAGDALGVDWLRATLMYTSAPGRPRISMAAEHQLVRYFPWWGTVLLHGLAAGALLLVARIKRGLSPEACRP